MLDIIIKLSKLTDREGLDKDFQEPAYEFIEIDFRKEEVFIYRIGFDYILTHGPWVMLKIAFDEKNVIEP